MHNNARLLQVESRPFQRLTAHTLRPEVAGIAHLNRPQRLSPADREALAQWKAESLLDVSLYELHITRMAATHKANAAQRAQYDEQKERSLAAAQATRDDTAKLRAELAEAQAELAQRKVYDEHAAQIGSGQATRSREQQLAMQSHLRESIDGLKTHVDALNDMRTQRHGQFAAIMQEARAMLDMMRGEKDEATRRESVVVNDDAKLGLAALPRPKPAAGQRANHGDEEEGEVSSSTTSSVVSSSTSSCKKKRRQSRTHHHSARGTQLKNAHRRAGVSSTEEGEEVDDD